MGQVISISKKVPLRVSASTRTQLRALYTIAALLEPDILNDFVVQLCPAKGALHLTLRAKGDPINGFVATRTGDQVD